MVTLLVPFSIKWIGWHAWRGFQLVSYFHLDPKRCDVSASWGVLPGCKGMMAMLQQWLSVYQNDGPYLLHIIASFLKQLHHFGTILMILPKHWLITSHGGTAANSPIFGSKPAGIWPRYWSPTSPKTHWVANSTYRGMDGQNWHIPSTKLKCLMCFFKLAFIPIQCWEMVSRWRLGNCIWRNCHCWTLLFLLGLCDFGWKKVAKKMFILVSS